WLINKPVGPSRLFDTMMRVVMGDATSPRAPRCRPQPQGPAIAHDTSGVRVLVAEDNEINSMVVGDLLADAGFQVRVVSNGLQAVEAVTQEPYAIVLMDCQMPEMDGFEATRKINELHRTGQIDKLPV